MSDLKNSLPPEIQELAEDGVLPSCPKNLKAFMKKCMTSMKVGVTRRTLRIHEKALIVYFKEQSKFKRSSTVWSYYSIIRCSF